MKDVTTQPFFSLLTLPNTLYRPLQENHLNKLHRLFYQYVLNHPDKKTWLMALHTAMLALLPAVGVVAFGLSWLGAGLSFWLPCVLGAATAIAGTVFSVYEYYQFRAIAKQEDFRQVANGWQPPQNVPHPWTKSPHATFNQLTSFYCDEHNRLWYALRESPLLCPDWKPLYIPDLPQHAKFDLKADGQNIDVKVTQAEGSEIYYKKVYEDKRDKDKYHLEDLCESPHSESQWFLCR